MNTISENSTRSNRSSVARVLACYARYGRRMPSFSNIHLKPATAAYHFGFRVSYSGSVETHGYGDFGAGSGVVHFLRVSRGLARGVRLTSMWHEIAHGLDWTEPNGKGDRLAVDYNRFSDGLVPLLRLSLPFLVSTQSDGSDVSAAHPLCIAHYVRKFSPEMRAWGDNSIITTPAELFAESVALAVVNPLLSFALNPELHNRIARIMEEELSTCFPLEPVAEFVGRLKNPPDPFPMWLARAISTAA